MEYFLYLVSIAMFFSSVAQTVAQSFLASDGRWNFAPGWQNEIAAWNVSMVIIVIGIVFFGGLSERVVLTFALSALTFLLGWRHLQSFFLESVPLWHLVLGILNVSGGVLGVIALLWYQREKNAPPRI